MQINKPTNQQTNMENEIQHQIAVKRREQYLATHGFILKAVSGTGKKRAFEIDSHHMDIVYEIADRNRREYEYDIDCLQDKIKLLHETDPSKILDETRRKNACFKLVADHTATTDDINRHVYERIRQPSGKMQMGLFERVKSHIQNGTFSIYDLENIQNLYMRLLYLFDLVSHMCVIHTCIFDFYNLALTLPKTGNIGEFIDRYIEAYLIPQKLNRFTLRAKLLRQLPLCDDVICEIFSFLNDDGICSRQMIDTRVYA